MRGGGIGGDTGRDSGGDAGKGNARRDRARLGALALFACALVAVLLPLPLLAGGGRPAWVERFPRDPDAYIGIGRSDKRTHPETFRELARDAALAQISREISVEVASTAASVRREDAAGWEETYSARTATTSRNSLTGYRLEGVYETPDEFWAYYVLDKETFRAALVAKENRLSAWLEGEAAALGADLDGRRLQSAADRYVRILKTYEAEFSGDPALQGRPSPLPAALDAVSGTFREAVRGLRLASDPARWVFTPSSATSSSVSSPDASSPDASSPGAIPSQPLLSLIDGAGKRWAGPYSLVLTDRFPSDRFPSDRMRSGSAACRVETDAEGRLDPAQAFIRCGMEPGRWTVAWSGTEDRECRVGVEAILRKGEFRLSVSGLDGETSGGRSVRFAERLQHALAGSEGRYHRIVGGDPTLPVLVIRIREAQLDSLDGIFFQSIRADAVFPGASAPVLIRGKAGHADKERARSRAVGDFVKALNDSDFLHLASP